jgi:hypothetical protein
MGTGLPTKVMLGQTLVLIQVTFLIKESRQIRSFQNFLFM